MNRQCDVVIIGAGFTGMMIARRILDGRPNLSVVVVDKEPEPGRHASGRNSGVLHSGIYYPPDTLKSRFTLEGNRWWKTFCRQHNLPLLDTGKVIAAVTPAELPVLDRLEAYGRSAGLDPIRLEASELSAYEPAAQGLGGLYIAETAVTKPLLMLQTLRRELSEAGVIFVFGHAQQLPGALYTGRVLINAAGAGALEIAKHKGLGDAYSLVPFKGVYARLKEPEQLPIRGSIYPVPDLNFPFLGVHFTKTAGDNPAQVYVGPTALPALWPEDYAPGFSLGRLFRPGAGLLPGWGRVGSLAKLCMVNPKFRRQALSYFKAFAPSLGAGPQAGLRYIWQGARRLVPGLRLEDLESSSKCGIRPQLVHRPTGELVMDFLVEADDDSVHILNAISPAYTSAPAFAQYVVDEYVIPRLGL